MQALRRLGTRLGRDGRGFTRLEFGLLTAMLCAMVVNGIVTLGGGLGSSSRPMGAPVPDQAPTTLADLKPPARTPAP